MGGARSMYQREGKYMRGFVGAAWKKEPLGRHRRRQSSK